MKTTNIKHIASFVHLCALNGIRKVVISPGSRNAPLVTAFESHPDIQTYLIHDERVAAFYALGLAEGLGEPVIITCTSGSAPLNYSPAIAEAYYRQIPLFVVTADRPPELVDQGDGQTIRQKNVYSNFIKASFELPAIPHSVEDSNKVGNQAIQEIINHPTGPVHLNVPLYEPLYQKEEFSPGLAVKLEKNEIDDFDLINQDEILKVWNSSNKILILIGQNSNGALLESLRPLLERPEVAVLVESTSNVIHFYKIGHCIDRTLARIKQDEINDFKPDLLISCGGAIISKRIKRFLRDNKPAHNWRVGQFLIHEDTYQSLSLKINTKPAKLFNLLSSSEKAKDSNYGNRWKQTDLLAQAKHEEFLMNQSELSDLLAMEHLLDFLPENSNLHMGNSSVVRYCQLFNPIQSVTYFGNRGVSGIDGCLSTAIGISVSNPEKLNTLIIGDISFMYDSNGLWQSQLPGNLRVIVINNGGGGIFKILPDANNSEHHDRFYAPHQPNIKGVCEAFHVDYVHVNTVLKLEEAMADFYSYSKSDRPKILEIQTSDSSNEVILSNYFKFVAE